MFSHEQVADGIFMITAPCGEKTYLVLGSEKAALIDTGMGVGSLRSFVRELTPLPLIVVNTHGHPDHAGGNAEFEECYLHPADLPWFEAMCTLEYRSRDVGIFRPTDAERMRAELLPQGEAPLPLGDGQRLSLGNRTLRVIHTPGHTPGSVCLWEEESRWLFAGDSLSGHAVWLYDRYSEPLEAYARSMARLKDSLEEERGCLIGHPPGCLPAGVLEDTITCARRVLEGDAQGTPMETFAGGGLVYSHGSASILYNPRRLFVNGRNEG